MPLYPGIVALLLTGLWITTDDSWSAAYRGVLLAHIVVEENSKILAGTLLAKTPRKTSKTKDITGGLPRVAELFEARRPKDAAEISKIDGIVDFGPIAIGDLPSSNLYIDTRLWSWRNGDYVSLTPTDFPSPEMVQNSGYWVQAKQANVSMRFPVAAKMALHRAGANGGSGGSPRPRGSFSLLMKCTSIPGA